MNCPRCDRELHAHIYIDAKEACLWCPWCDITVVPPTEIPDYIKHKRKEAMR